MRRTISWVLAAFLFAGAGSTLAMAAQTPGADDGDALAGTTWELTTLTGEDGTAVAIDQPANYTLSFMEAGELVIGADCNTALATYTIDGDSVSIDVGPMTLVYCGDESHSDAFVFGVGQSATYSLDDMCGLVLAAGEGSGSLELQRSLFGAVWQWDIFQSSDDSEIVPDDPTRFTIEFIDHETFAIGADCNRGRGTYTRNGSEIDLQVLLLTRAFCGDDSLDTQYLTFLDEVVSLVFRDGGLHLALPMDGGIMSFSPMPYGDASDQDTDG